MWGRRVDVLRQWLKEGLASGIWLCFLPCPSSSAPPPLARVPVACAVMSCKALGIALKLTFEGDNQMAYPQTYIFMVVVASAVVTQVPHSPRRAALGLL